MNAMFEIADVGTLNYFLGL